MRKRKTITRKLCDADYIMICWILMYPEKYKNGEILDISIYKRESIDFELKKRHFYVTNEENELIKDFLSKSPNRASHKNIEDIIAELGWEIDPKYSQGETL